MRLYHARIFFNNRIKVEVLISNNLGHIKLCYGREVNPSISSDCRSMIVSDAVDPRWSQAQFIFEKGRLFLDLYDDYHLHKRSNTALSKVRISPERIQLHLSLAGESGLYAVGP